MVRRHEVRDGPIKVVAGTLGIFFLHSQGGEAWDSVGLGTNLMCPLLPHCHLSVFIDWD